MQRVDLFGPFAVGKTYVTRQLFKDRTIKNSWISFDVFKEKTYKAMAIKNVNGFKKALFSIPLQINYPKRLILPLSLKILGYNLELYLLKEKHKDWSLFLENCITGIYLNKKYEIKKLQGACSLLHSCAKVNLANIYGDGHNIVFDESLSQGIYDVVEHLSTFQEKTVVRYFETMPPPDTLIYFKD